MAARGTKRKFEAAEPPICSSPSSASPIDVGKLGEESVELESSEDSTKSYLFDAASGATAQDDVELVARALSSVAAKSPEAVRQFIRRLTPEKMAGGGHTHWTEDELHAFLESCMEEIEARNITSSCPKTQGYANLQAKMLSKAGKHVSKQQVKNFWGACRRRFQTWTWLESMATGLGTNPYTGSIDASPEWWEAMEGMRKCARSFKNAPLRFIAEHHAVFRGRCVVGNRSSVPGAELEQQLQPANAELLDVEDLVDVPDAPQSPNPPSRSRPTREG
ncbi:hypothetical protein OsI_07637 [Oryza sativa Indica Group]|uniref:Myb/SANT-like domain-containing protein n=1 Tax=Oryza sativa subsp. indica TaxID=39946 RepID=B8AJF9_ORYSI|nr:hypothetical protein OsI_07637 [Oryza sativa Indica Group]